MHYTYQEIDWPWVWAIREGMDWREGLSMDELAAAEARQAEARVPVPLLYHIWIGSQLSCMNVEFLKKELGITHVINISGRIGNCPDFEGLEVLHLPDAVDVEGYPLLHRHLAEAQAFMATCVKADGMCVIFCEGGLNRSGLLAAALVLLETRWDVVKVVRLLRRQRGEYALDNESFQEQLVALARQNSCLGPPPVNAPPASEREVNPVNWYNMTLCDCAECK